MDFISTVKGSLLEHFYPEEWDFQKIDDCCSHSAEEIFEPQSFWNERQERKVNHGFPGGTYGNVSLGGIFSERVEGVLYPCIWI